MANGVSVCQVMRCKKWLCTFLKEKIDQLNNLMSLFSFYRIYHTTVEVDPCGLENDLDHRKSTAIKMWLRETHKYLINLN